LSHEEGAGDASACGGTCWDCVKGFESGRDGRVRSDGSADLGSGSTPINKGPNRGVAESQPARHTDFEAFGIGERA
jgi:hypothetical protein